MCGIVLKYAFTGRIETRLFYGLLSRIDFQALAAFVYEYE